MKSLFIPEESYGDDFAKQTYTFIVRRLKIDPIEEGRRAQKKIFNILNPRDLKIFQKESNREKARLKANQVAEIYINRCKKFWRVYQLYCFNRGQLRAVNLLKHWIKNSDKEIDNLKDEQKEILKGE